MPTVVRYVSKVALFVLVIAVSGVGVAQSQTGPGVVPSSPEAVIDGPAAGVITPDAVRQSARLYATAEQARPATISGGAEYMFSEYIIVSDNKIIHYTLWDFYKINGREDHFFVDTVSKASGRYIFPDEEYQVEALQAWLMANTSTARVKETAPFKMMRLPENEPVTFSLTYEGASISRTLPAAPTRHLYLSAGVNRDSMTESLMQLTYEGKDGMGLDHPEVITGAYLARWESGPPWGMTVKVWGRAYSPTQPGPPHTWEDRKQL